MSYAQMLITSDTTPEDFTYWKSQHSDAPIIIDDELAAPDLTTTIDRTKARRIDITEIISAVICGGSRLKNDLVYTTQHYSGNSGALDTIATHGSTPLDVVDLLLRSDFDSAREHARIAKISYFFDCGMTDGFAESFEKPKDLSIGEKWTMAQHAGAPEATLKALMLDEEEFTSSRAEAQLKSRGL